MSSSSSSDTSSSSDSVLSIHKSNVEFGQRNVSSWDPSTTTSDYWPTSWDSMENRRYKERYQENLDRPLDEDLESYWKYNCTDSIGSDRNRRSSFRSDVTGHDPNFDISAITVYDDSADYPSYSDERDSMEDSEYREQYNKNICRSLTDEVDSYQMGIYDEREDKAMQSTFQSGAYEDSADFSVSGISDVGDRWNMYKDVAETTWENTKGDMDTADYLDKKMRGYLGGSQKTKSSRSRSASPKKDSCCCSSKGEKSKSPGNAQGTFNISKSRSPSPKTSGYVEDDDTDENEAKLEEKLANHYTEKYLKSSPRKETEEYHQRMGWTGKAQFQRHSTFQMNVTREEPAFSASRIEGDGDPFANVLPNYDPTMDDMIEPESYEWPDSGIPSDCNLLDTADQIPAKRGHGTYAVPAKGQGTYAVPAKGQGTFNVPAKGQGTFNVPTKNQGTYNVPAKGQGTFIVPPKGHGTYAIPVDDAPGSRAQGTEGSVDLDSTSLFMEKLANHYTEKYLASSVGAETKAYHRRMGMDGSQKKQSTFGRGAKRRGADFSLSGIEGTGDPYAHVLANCEPTNYEVDDSGSYGTFVSELPSSFDGDQLGGGGGTYAVPAKPCGVYDGSAYNYPGSSGRSKSPTKDSDSPVSSCCCTTSTVDPPDRRPMQMHSTFDAQSTRAEPDFDMSAVEGDRNPYANQWQGSPTFSDMTNDLSFLFDPDDQWSEISQKLEQTAIGSKEYADLIEDMAACIARQKDSVEEDPNASIRQEMAMLDKDSPEYRQLAVLLAEAEGCPCDEVKPAAPKRQIPRFAGTGVATTASGAHKLRPSAAGTRIPAPFPRGQPVPRQRPPANRLPIARGRPPQGKVATRPQSRPVPGTVTIEPRARPCPGTVTILPRSKPCPATVTIQPRGKPVPGTVTVQPRAQPQAWPRYDPSTVTLRPTRPRSLAPPTRRTGDVSLRSRPKSAVPTPTTGSGCPASRQSRYRADTYQPQKASRPRSTESDRPRWRGANAPPPAMQRPPVVRFVPYPPRSRTTLARQQSGHERSRSEPPLRESTPRHRAALGPPRITGYDERVQRPQPRPQLFQSPAAEDPNASLREEMAMLDKNSPEYQQLAGLLAEAEGCPCDGAKQDDPNASLLEEMAMLDKDSPEYQQLAELLAEAEGRPFPEKSNEGATAADACEFIKSAMEQIPHDSVQYAKLMVMLMEVQGWDGNSRPQSPQAADPCEYIKAEMRNTDRNSTKYIQLEQMLLECEGENSMSSSGCNTTLDAGKTMFQRAKEDYFRMNPSVDGKRPTGLRKFSEKYPKPDIDFDPYVGGPDYSAFFAGDSPPSNSPLLRARDAERSFLRREVPIYDPPRPRASVSPPEFDERMRFHATSPRQADRVQYMPQPREPEFRKDYFKEDLSLQNPSCYCAKEEKEPLFAKNRSLPLEEDLEPRYSR